MALRAICCCSGLSEVAAAVKAIAGGRRDCCTIGTAVLAEGNKGGGRCSKGLP